MKISLRWVLEHVCSSSSNRLDFDYKDLIARANESIVEIEGFSTLNIDKTTVFAATVVAINNDQINMFCAELNCAIKLPLTSNSLVEVGNVFLLKKDTNQFSFLKLSDIGGEKDSLLPSVEIDAQKIGGDWKQDIPWNDVILDVDNKSLTNRPDMWCHRGFAREFCLILNKDLMPAQDLLKQVRTIEKHDFGQLNDPDSNLSVSISRQEICSFYCAIKLNGVVVKPSDPKMAFYLARVGFKPINKVVDLTNYVCADWGQPMHAFDARNIEENRILVREAVEEEQLLTLEGNIIALDETDIVISDARKGVALAGIIGSANSKISPETTSVVLESATFPASMIRKSSLRHKIRTESSARFEKTLDRTRAVEAVYRFIYLAKQFGLPLKVESNLLCLGKPEELTKIFVAHDFLEKKIGNNLNCQEIQNILETLGFKVNCIEDLEQVVTYEVTVPSWRGSKDIKIQEDIVEEVARCYGFNKIKPVLPLFHKDLDYKRDFQTLLKDFLVYSMDMFEQYNYCFVDVDFAQQIGDHFQKDLYVVNPVNANYQYLVSSLIPGLLKNVLTNLNNSNELRFFEVAKTWQQNDKSFVEQENCAGIFLSQDGKLDYLSIKSRLFKAFEFMGVVASKVELVGTTKNKVLFNQSNAVFDCLYQGKCIGTFGVLSNNVLRTIGVRSGNGFFFEFNLDLIKSLDQKIVKFKNFGKHPVQTIDISVLATSSAPAIRKLAETIKQSSELIFDVNLIDNFTRPEWNGSKSLTFRIMILGKEQTLTKQELEDIFCESKKRLEGAGVSIR